jgi:hypothetical protein
MIRTVSLRWLLAALFVTPAAALRSVPTDPPTFSDPLHITNAYQPFPVGGFKSYAGLDGRGQNQSVLSLQDNYLSQTRTFQLNGASVAARILEEVSYEDGQLVEISRNHFAQADDGSVYYFGEVVDIYDGGGIVSHDGSWLVGGPTLPDDPPETADALGPTLFMPANPEKGDVFKQEDLFPFVDETDKVRRVGLDVTTEAGAFEDAIEILETSLLDRVDERKWYAPGLGAVKARAQDGEEYELTGYSFP